MGPFAFRLFGRSRAEQDADRLFAVVTAVARRPSFYGEGRVPDSFDGRFEVLVAVAALALMRLK
ncbi:MAG: ubiquinol-cytochrome C chaperone, partial [Alphaproteobacteria bacterium]|nr:ubiquinol-cytochrome C chaperone [Alphaproteobacteria bacterium]